MSAVPAHPRPRPFDVVLICCSIAANALCAGGIFIFPLLSPALALKLKLTQPQLTTIVLAGMIGQYPFSAFVGKAIDRHGPAVCSLIAALLFSFAFRLFSVQVSAAQPEPTIECFRNLSFLFLLAGFGTVFSYFSSVFAATKTFPMYPGIASGTSMALFGLSPLLLSTIATTYFISPITGLLDVPSFMDFLAYLTAFTHLVGFVVLRKVNSQPASSQDIATPSDEQTPLLPPKLNANDNGSPILQDAQSTLDLLQDPEFWLLAFYCLLIFGACEMVISNMGTIVLSLRPPSLSLTGTLSGPDHAIAKQIRLLSLANTISRVVMGPLADFLSPVGLDLTSRWMSRVVFLSLTSLLVTSSFLWTALFARAELDVWGLSVGIGAGYGATFTVLPSIIRAIWGEANLGRNFGIVTYAPFVGTPLFSYLYAFISSSHMQVDDLCRGTACWSVTFTVCIGTSLLAFGASCLLRRRWEGRL
ncbi:MFS general substrate transporter [Pluteus cervinus]|uniref:MFS general substrate transporter n=1 Tax=Pluteus cervinus TaxID=181527 RepID=A0ACD3BED4_9AGAR|nr:MFS general substrate transporter [Pluteus cervinus]